MKGANHRSRGRAALLGLMAAAMTSAAALGETSATPDAAPAAARPASELQKMNDAAAANAKRYAWLTSLRKEVPPSGISKSVRNELINGQYFVDDPALTAYLTEITDRLLTAWKGPRPAIQVLVKSSEGPCAYSTQEGEIVVCTGMLRAVQSEKALAALLSHELAHILLNHPAKTANSFSAELVVHGAGLVFAAAAIYGGTPDSKGALDMFYGTQAVTAVWADLVRTKRNRDEEKAADALGTDLMIGSGIDTAGFDKLYPILADATGFVSSRMQALQVQAFRLTIEKAGEKVPKDAALTVAAVLALAKLTQVQKGAFERLGELNVDYDPIAERMAVRKDYERVTYAPEYIDSQPAWRSGKFDSALRGGATATMLAIDQDTYRFEQAQKKGDVQGALVIGRALPVVPGKTQPRVLFITSQVARRTGNLQDADALMYQLTQTRFPPASAFNSLAELRGKQLNRPKEATVVLEDGKTKLRAVRPFLPLLPGMYVRAGDLQKAEEYGITCGCHSDRKNLSGGDEIAKVLMGDRDESLKNACIEEMQYNVFVERRAPKLNAFEFGKKLVTEGFSSMKQCYFDD